MSERCFSFRSVERSRIFYFFVKLENDCEKLFFG